MKRGLALFAAALAMVHCAKSGPPPPAELDTGNEPCRFCRMLVSDPRRAAQIVASSEEPLFFDDVGCLRDYLAANPDLPEGAIAYVADARTKAWIAASKAVYTRNPSIDTPMGSHLLAHADIASRDADPEAREGTPLSPKDVFGPSGPPDGHREK
jgi:copper chaperone NosL